MPNTLKNMTNYEKLCTLLDIMKQPHNYYYTGAVWHYPVFDEKKQIKLIELLAKTESFTADFSEIPPRNDNEQWACMCNFKSGYGANFAEALAGLTLQLVKAGELDKEEVRKILE